MEVVHERHEAQRHYHDIMRKHILNKLKSRERYQIILNHRTLAFRAFIKAIQNNNIIKPQNISFPSIHKIYLFK